MQIKRVFSVVLAVFLVFSTAIVACAAGNHKDTIVTILQENNNDGTPYSSFYREKWDYTSSYVYNYPESKGSLNVWVNSDAQNNANKRVDRKYCGIKGGQSIPYNGPSLQIYVPKGEYRYLLNFCREDYYKYSGYSPVSYASTDDPYATLGYIMNVEHVYYKIAWSPDSV